MQITIDVSFPNNDLDNPTITTSSSDSWDIPDTENSISFVLNNTTPGVTNPGLVIDQLKFFGTNDTAKATPLDPGFFSSSAKQPDGSWLAQFDDRVAVDNEVDLAFEIWFNDTYRINLREDDLTWDPTIKVKPRSAAQPPAEAGAGA